MFLVFLFEVNRHKINSCYKKKTENLLETENRDDLRVAIIDFLAKIKVVSYASSKGKNLSFALQD